MAVVRVVADRHVAHLTIGGHVAERRDAGHQMEGRVLDYETDLEGIADALAGN